MTNSVSKHAPNSIFENGFCTGFAKLSPDYLQNKVWQIGRHILDTKFLILRGQFFTEFAPPVPMSILRRVYRTLSKHKPLVFDMQFGGTTKVRFVKKFLHGVRLPLNAQSGVGHASSVKKYPKQFFGYIQKLAESFYLFTNIFLLLNMAPYSICFLNVFLWWITDFLN